MSGIQVRRTDIESLTELVDGLSAPGATKELLSSIVTAIRDTMGPGADEAIVTVLQGESVQEQFAGAFTAAESTHATGRGVAVTVTKVGR